MGKVTFSQIQDLIKKHRESLFYYRSQDNCIEITRSEAGKRQWISYSPYIIGVTTSHKIGYSKTLERNVNGRDLGRRIRLTVEAEYVEKDLALDMLYKLIQKMVS